jgi:hydrogenase nickel incorporation protein HypB
MVLTKTDLLPHVPFDPEIAIQNARRVHAEMDVVRVSCLTGEGMPDWLKWLAHRQQAFLAGLAPTCSLVS